nr:general RNA polymerase II transcription factor [Polyrhizophydium stewartii]
MSFIPREGDLLVLDPGSLCTRLGTADYQNPPAPPVLSRVDKSEVGAKPAPGEQSGEWVWPLADGRVADWAALRDLCIAMVVDAERICIWVRFGVSTPPRGTRRRVLFVKGCGVDRSTNSRPVLLNVPATWSRGDQERATQVLFEYINAPGVFLLDQALASLYGVGVTSGLVVDVGHSTTTISPVFDNVVLHGSVVTLPVGGRDVEEYMVKLMCADSAFSQAYGHLIGSELARAIMESPTYSAPIIESFQLQPAEVEFKGEKVTVGALRGDALRVLFHPDLVGKDVIGVHEAIHVVISIRERFEKEIAPLIAASETSSEYQAKEIKWLRLPDYLVSFKDRPAEAAFLGGSITAKIVFANNSSISYITKADYNQYGPASAILKSARPRGVTEPDSVPALWPPLEHHRGFDVLSELEAARWAALQARGIDEATWAQAADELQPAKIPDFVSPAQEHAARQPLSQRHHFAASMRSAYLKAKRDYLHQFSSDMLSGLLALDLSKVAAETQDLQRQVHKIRTDALDPAWEDLAMQRVEYELQTKLYQAEASRLEALFGVLGQVASMLLDDESASIAERGAAVQACFARIERLAKTAKDVMSFLKNPAHAETQPSSFYVADHDKMAASINSLAADAQEAHDPGSQTGNAHGSTHWRTDSGSNAPVDQPKPAQQPALTSEIVSSLCRVVFRNARSSVVLPAPASVYDLRDQVRNAAAVLKPMFEEIEQSVNVIAGMQDNE